MVELYYPDIRWELYQPGVPEVDRYCREHKLLRDEGNIMGKGIRGAWIQLIHHRKFVTDGLISLGQPIPLRELALECVRLYKDGERYRISPVQSYDPYYLLFIVAEILGEQGNIITTTGKIHTRIAEARIKKSEKLEGWEATVYEFNVMHIHSDDSNTSYVLAPILEPGWTEEYARKTRRNPDEVPIIKPRAEG